MAKANNNSLAICLTTFCLCLLLFTSITKAAWPQDETKIQTLINSLKDPKAEVRSYAAMALKDIGPQAKSAVPALIEVLKDKDKNVSVAAGLALASIGAEAVPALIEVLKDDHKVFRILAAWVLAQIGPEAKSAVPVLIEAFKDKDTDVRQQAAQALGFIGPGAKAAVPVLIEALKDEHKGVRKLSAEALGRIGIEAKAAVPDLIEAVNDKDTDVRQQAAQALGFIGPEAKAAVPALIKALEDENASVRKLAVEALGKIGIEAKAAVPDLIEAFKNENLDVRRSAARALDRMGPEAKAAVPALFEALKNKDENHSVRMISVVALIGIGPEAMPALIEALKVEDRDICNAAAFGLGKIATALRDDKATGMIKDLKTAKDALSAYPDFNEQENTVRRAIEYLEQIKPPWWENIPKWVYKNKLKSSLILVYILWAIAWLITFWLHPFALLRINQALKPFDFQLPKQFGAIKLPIRFLLFVGFLNYRPRVLNAWVKKYIPEARERFSEKPTVYDRNIHISVPVEFDRQTIPDLTPKHLRPKFARQIGCLLIWGEGGSGKTSMACQMAKWAMSTDREARICKHLLLPVLIEQEFISNEGQSTFINAVNRQVQDLTDQADPIADELLEHLLKNRRILVIVDHLSEMSKETRDQIQPERKGFPANAFIVTSRLEEALGGVTKTLIKPLRIRRDRLSPFMEAYLTHRGKSGLFTDSEFHDSCRRLTEMVGDRDLTLLLAKLYSEQLIAAKEAITDDKLPKNIPNLMLSYLNELNRNVAENKIDDRIIHKNVKALAWKSLKETYRPASVQIDDAVTVLAEENAKDHLEYLENSLRLIKTDPVTKDRFKFLVDPLSEYLAALHLLDLNGEKEETWWNFLAEADGKEGAPEAIKGFLLAVRDCIIAKSEEANIPDFVADELAKRAGLDIEAIKRAQKEQRIQRLINQLSFPETFDRQQAAEALGKIGLEAKVAVPALVEALKDEDNFVREAVADALRNIGPEAKAAVPDLIEAIKDERENVRYSAVEALRAIGPGAKSAEPDLIEAIKDEKERVRYSAVQALRAIGSDAKSIVPTLIKAIKDKHQLVRMAVAEALGDIGKDTKESIPTLIMATKDKHKFVRWAAANALGEIGPKAIAGIPRLIETLEDEIEEVREAAAEALKRIRPQSLIDKT